MWRIFICALLSLVASSHANICGPYLFWGHERLSTLQPFALVEASEEDFVDLYKDVKAIVVFVRNSTGILDSAKYPKFQKLINESSWAYLPQRSIREEPFSYNTYIEVINLSGSPEEDDNELISSFNDAVTIYGAGEVLGILANREEDAHFLAKREAKSTEEDSRTTTAQTPVVEEIDKSFIYLADGKKAILYVNTSIVLNISNESIKLVEHNKAATFDDHKRQNYVRFSIIFHVDGAKLFMRFNFTVLRGTWSMKAVEIDYKGYRNVLPIVGTEYNIPSAPIGFSYRCSSRPMVFRNEEDVLVISDYQVQPWLNGASKFGHVYDCVGFMTAPIWAGILISFFLCGILSIGILAIMDIKTPNRFESSRSKQLTFTVQE